MKKLNELSQGELLWIEEIIGRMTVEEKVGQLNQLPLSYDGAELEELVRSGATGSLVLAYTPLASGEEKDSQVEVRKALQQKAMQESRLKIPLLYGRDVIHGHRTVFPIPFMQANSWNPELIQKANEVSAVEAMEDEVHWAFTPMLDIARDPRWGRVVEGYGEDSHLTSRLGDAAVTGLQSRIAACAKHFIGYGAVEGGRDYNTTEISDYSLYNTYLLPFQKAVQAGVMTIMASFNDISGEAVTGSYRLLTKLLKEELGFQGFIVSDWDAVAQLIHQNVAKDRREAAKIAFLAGVDMDMASTCFIEHLPSLVRDNEVSLERLDDAVRRVLKVKMALGLFEPKNRKSHADDNKHLEIAEELALNSMVLLKNHKQALPLEKGAKIGVLGSFVKERRSLLGSWTLDGDLSRVLSLEEALRPYTENTVVLDDYDFHAIKELSGKVDKIIVAIGEYWDDTGEARGSSALSFPRKDMDLLHSLSEAEVPVITLVYSGRPLLLEEVTKISDSILYAGHSGSMTSSAIAKLLFGIRDPIGKLAFTYPKSAGQVPIYYNVRASGRKIDEYYGVSDFSSYQDFDAKPEYPFGYGMHYASVQYSGIQAEGRGEQSIRVTIQVENTGDRQVCEIVQCYISYPPSKYVRPIRQLIQFKRVMLYPNEIKEVDFIINHLELIYYQPCGKEELAAGLYKIYIGENSVNTLETYFEIGGWDEKTSVQNKQY